MDAFLLKQAVAEAVAALRGALVSKVHQPREREVVLTFWTGRDDKRLLLSADAEGCRLHLTTRKSPNPPSPPRFAQYLRKHLEGMRLESATVAPFDRSVRLDFLSTRPMPWDGQVPQEAGRRERPDAEHARATLFAELFGRHANLIFCDADGTILEPLRVVAAEESAEAQGRASAAGDRTPGAAEESIVREIRPGIAYAPLPPPSRPFLHTLTIDDCRTLAADGFMDLARHLSDSVSGLGRELARDVAARSGSDPDALFAAVCDLVHRYETDDIDPCIGTLASGKRRLLPFPCDSAGFVSYERFPSASEAADAFYGDLLGDRDADAIRQQIRSRLSALLKKERTKATNIEGDEERNRAGLAGKEAGESLKWRLGEISKGMTEFDGVALDPKLTPVENMERHFRLYKKAKRAVETVKTRKREVAESVFYLESLEESLAEAKTTEELLSVKAELDAAHPAKTARAATARKKTGGRKPVDGPKAPVPQVERIEFGGFTIYVGRNNVGNDRIVRELSAPEDLWLHAQGIPGSHVLVKVPSGREVPREVVEEAARLAVLHSKARGGSNVPVFLAKASDVSKFKGAKPGLVRIKAHTTVTVR